MVIWILMLLSAMCGACVGIMLLALCRAAKDDRREP